MSQQTVVKEQAQERSLPGSGLLVNNPAVRLWRSMIGKKVVMAVTGLILVGFVIGHMAGNLHMFEGQTKINEYAVFLRDFGDPLLHKETLLWLARVVLLVSVVLHVVAAVQLTRLNRAARPQGYEQRKSLRTTLAARTMVLGGLLLAIFIVFHILHLTLGVGISGFEHLAVYANVYAAFSVWYVTAFYVVAMAALGMHLYHGVWSLFQTLGCNSRQSSKALQTLAAVVAGVVFLGFISVPLSVQFKLVPPPTAQSTK